MALRWFRVYSDLLNNRKFQRLSDSLKVRLLNIWCLAAKYDGTLPEAADVAFELRISEDDVPSMIEELKGAGFLDESERGLVPHHWDEHQFVSDTSTGRVKRFRSKSRATAKPIAKQDGNESETPTETLTETGVKRSLKRFGNGTEQSRAEQKQSRAEHTRTVHTNGASSKLHADIEPGIERIAEQIHARHPAIRRCSRSEVEKLLFGIAAKFPAEKQTEVLETVNSNHAGWCKTNDWTKNGGQYAKGLKNWLNPIEELWNQEPPTVDSDDEWRNTPEMIEDLRREGYDV